MNTPKGIRFAGACLAIAALSTTLSACGNSDVGAGADSRHTVSELQPLEGNYAPPYDKQYPIGASCKLVTYMYSVGDIPVMRQYFYEYVIYGPNGTKDVIGKSRKATEEQMNNLLNTVPLRCKT